MCQRAVRNRGTRERIIRERICKGTKLTLLFIRVVTILAGRRVGVVGAGLVIALVRIGRSGEAIGSVREDGVRALTTVLQQVVRVEELLLVVVQAGGRGQEQGTGAGGRRGRVAGVGDGDGVRGGGRSDERRRVEVSERVMVGRRVQESDLHLVLHLRSEAERAGERIDS